MIPKTIHYCWFGRGEKPKLAQKCIASWKKYCPDYEIIEWNEDNFPIDQYPYAQYCLNTKKWAYLSDFARLVVVREHGGIYFDTDVELLRAPDELLQYEAFYGFENDANVATGLGFGAVANHCTIVAMERQYLNMEPNSDGTFPVTGCPKLNTQALLPFGLKLDGSHQNIAGAEILPADYLNPYDDPTGRLDITHNTFSVHWYSKSALSKSSVLRSKLTRPFHRMFGVDCFSRLKR